MEVLLDGESLNLENAVAIAHGAKIVFAPGVPAKVLESYEYVQKRAGGGTPIYGVNTGFGYFANKRISRSQLEKIQLNIVRSHAAGAGPFLSVPETRLAMALRLNVFAKGYSGVSLELCERLKYFINNEIYPLIPSYGSVGASGDLVPLAHAALPLIGEGEVLCRGRICSVAEALEKEGLKPLILKEKEGLGLINGTQIMLSIGILALAEAKNLIGLATIVAALSFEGMQASPISLHPNIHSVRGQTGQMIIAHEMSAALEGSYLHSAQPIRGQEPYSLRCAPQVMGAAIDAISYAILVADRELNAATDNPLVFAGEDLILSGGNFHGEPLAMAFDFAAIALSEIANIAERRLELLLNPHMSLLNAFLTKEEGVCSGYMAAQYLAASLVNECKLLANPASTDSIPGNVGVEDHVSMGMTSARKLAKLFELVLTVVALELLAACQAIDLRAVLPLGERTRGLYALLREQVPVLNEDRVIADDIQKAVLICRRFLS